MDVNVTAADVVTAKAVAMGSSAASSASAWLLFGAPLAVVVSSFFGAALILSFLPPRDGTRGRMVGTVILCTVLGILAAPLIAKNVSMLSGFDALTAFLIASIAQIILPMMIERRSDIATWVVDRIPGNRKDGEAK